LHIAFFFLSLSKTLTVDPLRTTPVVDFAKGFSRRVFGPTPNSSFSFLFPEILSAPDPQTQKKKKKERKKTLTKQRERERERERDNTCTQPLDQWS
jgi:hypothetical protein